MSLRLRRTVKIAPGVRLNLGLKSAGVRIGPRGLGIGFNTRTGTYASAGIPGTGLHYRTQLKGGSKRTAPAMPQDSTPPNPFAVPQTPSTLWALGCLGLFIGLIALAFLPIVGGLIIVGGFFLGYLADKQNAPKRTQEERVNQAAAKAWQAILEKRMPDALPHLDALSKLTPDNQAVTFYTSVALHEKDTVRARDLMLQFIKQNPDNAVAYQTMGVHLMKLQDYKNAERAFQQGQKKAGDDAVKDLCIIGRGEAILRSGNPTLALEVLKEIDLRRKIDDETVVELRYLRGLCCLEMNKKADAKKEFERVVAIDPNYEDAALKLAGL